MLTPQRWKNARLRTSLIPWCLALAVSDPIAAAIAQAQDVHRPPMPAKVDPGISIEAIKAKAEAGDADAQYHLGLHYETIIGDAGSKLFASKWYLQAHFNGHIRATGRLGVLCLSCRVPAMTAEDGLKLLLKAAEAGDANSQALIAQCYSFGLLKDSEEVVPKVDRDVLFRWLGVIGSELSSNRWSLIRAEWGMSGLIKPTPKSTIHWCQLAAKQGHAAAIQMLLDYHLEKDRFDAEPTLRYMFLAMESDDLLDRITIAMMTPPGGSQIPEAQAIVVRAKMRAIEGIKKELADIDQETDPVTVRVLGNVFASGLFVEKDESLARELRSVEIDRLRELCKLGNPTNMFRLSEALERDMIDMSESFYWLELAGLGGHIVAQRRLANRYQVGRGVPMSPDLAEFWSAKAKSQEASH